MSICMYKQRAFAAFFKYTDRNLVSLMSQMEFIHGHIYNMEVFRFIDNFIFYVQKVGNLIFFPRCLCFYIGTIIIMQNHRNILLEKLLFADN